MTTSSITTTSSLVSPPVRSPHTRRGWIIAGSLLVVAMVLVLGEALVSDIAYLPLPSHHRIFRETLTAINVRIDSGTVVIEPASGATTTVDSSGSRGLVAPTDAERVSRGTLRIRSSCHPKFFSHCNRNYVLHVGPSMSVSVTTGEGSVIVRGMNGTLSLRTGQGGIDVSSGHGSLWLSSGQGSIFAFSRARSVYAISGQGNIDLHLLDEPNHVTAMSGQGGIAISLPKGSGPYRVESSSGEGSISTRVSNSPLSDRVVKALSGQGDVSIVYGAR